MKVSVCITVLNEEKYIDRLLISLFKQTKKVDEIVIVDGGSKDKTLEIIKKYAKDHKEIKYVKKQSTVAQGRNEAIKLATNEIIATTDASCVANRNWLEKLTKKFEKQKTEVVAGYYNIKVINPQTKIFALYLGIQSNQFNKNIMPSTRSVAFKKSVWRKVDGFDENLVKTGEDTKFFYQCLKNGVKIDREKNARVEWLEISDMELKSFFNKVKAYAFGDAQIKIWWHPKQKYKSHNIKIFLIYLRYLIELSLCYVSIFKSEVLYFLLFFLFLYILWPVLKWRNNTNKLGEKIWLPVVQVVSDIAVMIGFAQGMMQKK